MAKTKTWELPEGRGQGPKPDPSKHLPPLKKANNKLQQSFKEGYG